MGSKPLGNQEAEPSHRQGTIEHYYGISAEKAVKQFIERVKVFGETVVQVFDDGELSMWKCTYICTFGRANWYAGWNVEEVKPLRQIKCPFCGENKFRLRFDPFGWFQVYCASCRAQGPATSSESSAKNEWRETTGHKQVHLLTFFKKKDRKRALEKRLEY